jgi:hypothetical protein
MIKFFIKLKTWQFVKKRDKSMEAKAIQTSKYLEVKEIQEHLENVEYVIMATSAPEKFKDTPIHFTIFLNTQERFPQDIQDAILDKFLDDNKIKNPKELMSQLMPVGFGVNTGQDTAMPMLLIKQDDMRNIPHVPMFVMDFLADSDNFYEAKVHKLTGWTYSYN